MKTAFYIVIGLIIVGIGYWSTESSKCGQEAKIYADLGGYGASAENKQTAYDFKYKACMDAKGF